MQIDNEKVYNLVKRPGLSQYLRPSGTTGTGRGVYSWKGDLYSVIGTKLYKNSTDLGLLLQPQLDSAGSQKHIPSPQISIFALMMA